MSTTLEVIERINLKGLQQKITDFKEELEAKSVELCKKDKEMKEWRKRCEDTIASKKIWLLIGPPYQNSRFWIGIPSPEALLNQCLHVCVCNWDSTSLAPIAFFGFGMGSHFVFLQDSFKRTNAICESSS